MNDIDIMPEVKKNNMVYVEKIELPQEIKKKKKNFLKPVIISVATLIFIIAAVFCVRFVMDYEGTQPLPREEIVYPDAPVSSEDIVLSLRDMLDDSMSFKGVKLDVELDLKVIDESIIVPGADMEAVRQYSEHIRNSFVSMISSEYDTQRYKGEYGDDFSEKLFSTQYLAHSVKISSLVNSQNENELFYNFDYNEDTLSVRSGEVVFRKLFDIEADTYAFGSLNEKNYTAGNTGSSSVSYDDFTMLVSVDRLKNEINYIQQKRVLNVTMPLSFIGEFGQPPSTDISFTLEIYKTFSFSRVSFSFDENIVYLKKGSTGTFAYEIVSEESPSDAKVEFVSSDPSVLSIKGNTFRGVNVSDKPVKVTAFYTYKGVIYEDSCLYYVTVPVKGVKVSEKDISLRVGDTAVISADIAPKNATVKSVRWFSDNEIVAAVDDSGVITAVSNGTASVYCITLDGNFKSVCNVSVGN